MLDESTDAFQHLLSLRWKIAKIAIVKNISHIVNCCACCAFEIIRCI